MNEQLVKDMVGWGVAVWAAGYVLGIILFMVVPHDAIGWVIMPIGIVMTLWVLLKKIRGQDRKYYVVLGVGWAAIAVVLDYLLLVRLFKPADGYYKLDVYLYYILTLVLPMIVGWKRYSRGK